MKHIRVLIIDDEPAAIDVIKELCNLEDDLLIEGTAINGVDAVKAIIKHKPDLIFLDVDMPLMNGMEVIEKLPGKDFEIIFTTGYSDYALKALKLEAVDYLLKPIDPGDFLVAIEKARNKLFVKFFPDNERNFSRIQLPAHNGIIYLEMNNILHITGMGSYSEIFTVDSEEKITVSKNIGHLAEKLSVNFFRCHNSHIINLNHVNRFISKDGFFVIMKNGSQVEVSRRNKESLLDKLAQ